MMGKLRLGLACQPKVAVEAEIRGLLSVSFRLMRSIAVAVPSRVLVGGYETTLPVAGISGARTFPEMVAVSRFSRRSRRVIYCSVGSCASVTIGRFDSLAFFTATI